ncbi:lipopolysaccharide export system permease protein [Faunimonas pinastri]|uniref:Lipopolysaccharide export system permease protein n=1 Tax=Faunimonas pinastri TaxID=1855383 RepID=A0A1H9D031_9HYPH|nr:LPS export ABC transporter permease LptF [Faunimonas pinastri]SEQ06727.1 lipopolysaccharide export system permease protein [Faunimonas pinastri]
MSLFERYVFRRATSIFMLTLCALVGTLWMTQVLRELDVVTAKGQTIWIFLVMTLLAMPAIIQVIAPIAFLVASLVTLNGLNGDSEMAAISAAGASRKVVIKPIVTLAVIVMIGVAILHHFVAPGSLQGLRGVVTRVRADLISTLVKDGGFRTVEEGLTMHIREKAPDGSFRGIFVSDDRSPDESLQYTAQQGLLVENDDGSFLILKDGDLIRENRQTGSNSVVDFQTYALDLSELTASNSATQSYKPRERMTTYLLHPDPDDAYLKRYPERFDAELHDRITAPLYTLAFAFIVLTFFSRPRTNRQDRSLALASAVVIALILRAIGFALVASANSSTAVIPLMYIVPLAGIALSFFTMVSGRAMPMPAFLSQTLDAIGRVGQRVAARLGLTRPRLAGEGR